MADRDPAGRGLEVRERRAGDGGQGAISRDVVDRYRPVARAVVRIGHEQLVWVGRAKFATEGPDLLRREWRAWGSRQAPIDPDTEAIDEGRPSHRTHLRAHQVTAVAAEQDLAGQRGVGEGNRRSGDPPQVPAGIQPE